jgi:hypothetical protein
MIDTAQSKVGRLLSLKMNTAQIKTKVDHFKFRFKILFFGWLTLTILSIPSIIKFDQIKNHKSDTFEVVAKFHACVFIDKLGLQKSKLLPQPCKNYANFLKFDDVAKTQKLIDFAPVHSLILMFVLFALVLQKKKEKEYGL